MISSWLSRTSAAMLGCAGLAMLFAPDELLPRLAPGIPAGASWVGQLAAAGWLGLAMLNWTSRAALLGGVYGRPIVLANALAYFIGATTLLKRASVEPHSVILWAIAVPVVLLAVAYGRLLFGGAIESDMDRFRSGATAERKAQ